ncbi:hypothetical protein [Pseudomonas sp. MBLB4136]|uniref:hypothetical protein n=1 Tax=Pseudomonas sp. MBLB4136 TaxID=3451558 RepID=UPI003F74E6EB
MSLIIMGANVHVDAQRLEGLLAFPVRMLVVLFVFVGSMYIGPLYVLGDQVHYRKVYEGLMGLSLVEGYIYYTESIDSLEFVHFFFSWLAGRYLDKDIFVSIANSFLAWVAFGVFRRWGASVVVSAFLVATNYYLIAMYFSAERLKFGFIFLGLSLLYAERLRLFYFFSFLALVSHAQTVIVYAAIFFRIFCGQVCRFLLTGRVSATFLVVVVLLLVPVSLVSGQLLSKFYSYYDGLRGFDELLRVFVFLLLALYYARDKFGALLVFVPLVLVVMLVGGDRVNILAYFVFLYYALPVNKGLNAGVLVTTVYFLLGSFEYVSNIFEYGSNKP